MLNRIKNLFHFHLWTTTHTNRWFHATRQVCRCGLSREFKYMDDPPNAMPWDMGEWVYSDGTKSKYDGVLW